MIIRDYTPADQPAFQRLNEAWITHYFTLEEPDRQVLQQPESYVLARGGAILLAEVAGRVVGTAALQPTAAPATLELAKMAVDPTHHGQGIGERLGRAAVARARALGARCLYLETNARLGPALRLYERLGFRPLPPPAAPSPYARADVFMELLLG